MGRLRYLRLDRVSIRWNGLITPRLSTLILQNIPILLGPSLSQLFDILTACPRLATLHIVAVNGLDRISHTNSINALHLRDLVLISIPTTVVEYIMKFLHGPPSRSDAQQAATLDRCLEYPSTDSLFWATTKRTVLGVSHIVVKKMRNYIRFSSDGQWKLEIDLANMHAVHEMLLWFRDATKICGEKMPPIRLELNEHDYRSDVSTLGLLATLENITHLKFGRSYSQPISAIQYLSRNLELGYNTHSWPFNGLQELYTEYPYRALLWSITEMIRERQTPGGNTVLPTPLRRIILGSEDRTSPDEPFDAFWPNPLQNMLQIATSTGTQIQWYGRQVMADGTLDVV
ncbi:hypothetical protein FRC01_014854 [Tulasnella sp. 417]|nr:hypothetical protein FRC01_014854 [Tulasnella sp. 417]